MNENNLLELCRYTVRKAESMGMPVVEVQAKSTSQVQSDVELAQISSVSNLQSDQLAIRIYLDKKMGCSFTNILTEDASEKALKMALSSAKATTADEDWVSLSMPQQYPTVKGLWDEAAATCNPSTIVDLTSDILEKASEAEAGMVPVYGGSSSIVGYNAYANSNGVYHAERGTAGFIMMAAIAQTSAGVTPMISSYDISRGIDFKIDETIEDLAQNVRICKNVVEGKSGKQTVIMHPFAYGQIFTYTLLQSIRGDNVARGKSMIADRLGDKVASERISLYDDGLYKGAFNTSVADDECVPHRKTPIIEDGILRSFIWDTYWANKMGVESTGNASRSARQGLMNISPTTITVEPGTKEFRDIISDIDYGFYIRNVQGAHSSNPESGDFSIVGNPAVLVKNGEMIGAVNGLMLAGNVYDLLNQVDQIAKTPYMFDDMVAPEISFSDVNVITRG